MMRWLEKNRWETVYVAAVVLVGVAARSWQIGYSFDDDEIFSAHLASGDFAQVMALSFRDATHPPLYNILLHLWFQLFAPGEVSARALSVFFSCGFLVFAYLILRRYLDRWIALAALVLFALSPYFVFYGQEVRPYSLIAMLAAANLYVFLRILDAPERRWPMRIWALLGVALVYSQYMGTLFIASQIAWGLYRLPGRRLRLLAYGTAAMLSVVPWLAAALAVPGARASPLHQIAWMVRPRTSDLVWFYASLFGTQLQIRWLALVLAALVAVYAWRAWAARRLAKEHLLFLLLAVGLPCFVFALSLWGPKPVFVARQLAGPAMAAIVAVGLMLGAMPRLQAAATALALIVWCAISLPAALPENMNCPWRDTAQWIDGHYGAIEVVVADPPNRLHLQYYRRLGTTVALGDRGQSRARGSFLYLCRVHFCARAGSEAVLKRAVLVRTWRWNRSAGEIGFNQLRLYAVRDV